MTVWIVRYGLSCGHNSGRVTTTEKNKMRPGDWWFCAVCQNDSEIVSEEGHGA